ncbi:MAG: DNA repair protein RecN [Melioribacteraceae bacterium]|nr:DNA repair protein RecN [Melioribacteraceae bacterium]
MLKSLFIKDYALIETTEIEFGKGLNIITGETGAGKSILVDAMGLLLGERASSDVVRKGAEKSIVEGVFDVTNNKLIENFCNQNEIEFNDELIVRREISVKGTNRCFLNDSPVPLSHIKEIGNLLVDLHGQHEHQSLLRVETHIDFLDQVSDAGKLLNEYQIQYKELINKLKFQTELLQNEKILKEKKELYEFQIKEIDAVNPHLDEEDKLEDELKVLENSEKLLTISSEIYDLLYESENSIIDSLGYIKNKLNELNNIDKSISNLFSDFESSLNLLKDVSHSLRSYKDNISLDPERLNEIRERLASIILLKKKYGGTLKAVIDYREKIGNEFEIAENFSNKINEIENEILQLRSNLGIIAKSISSKRNNVSKKIKKETESILKLLGIPDSKFEVNIQNIEEDNSLNNFVIVDDKKYKCNEKGIDFIEFFISTNYGEDLKPLTKVASGGEVSRIMLALKSVLAKTDKLPILIFDEIDTGISGRIAQKVGSVLHDLANNHQIIAITHLPQIASFGDYHFKVEKSKNNDRVVSQIKLLNENERINEIAKLISGEEVTETTMKSALELINNRTN